MTLSLVMFFTTMPSMTVVLQLAINFGMGLGSVLTINIPLPATYGQAGLTPAGETEAGWWKIEYQVGQANDTTTWQVVEHWLAGRKPPDRIA